MAETMQIQLLANINTGGNVVPCVPPLTPGPTSINSVSATVIDLAQGIPIPPPTVGFVFRWGTTSGGPYPNSKSYPTDSPSVQLTTADGLVADTQYYLVVYSDNGFGCLSANHNTELPIALQSTVVTDWVARVAANGGTAITAAQKTAHTDFVNGCVSDGIWSKMKCVNTFVNNGEIACMTPLLKGTGSDPWGRNVSVAGLITANGIVGAPGSNVSLTTGLIPNAVYSTNNSAGVSLYVSATNNNSNFEFGSFDTTGNKCFQFSTNFADTKSRADCWDNLAIGGEVQATVNKAGFFSANRTGANAFDMYFANSTNAFANVGSTAIAATGTTYGTNALRVLSTTTTGNATQSPTDRRLSFFAIHDGLTSAESQKLYNRVQALRTALGGGFV